VDPVATRADANEIAAATSRAAYPWRRTTLFLVKSAASSRFR
jgi:hypothetical protein